MLPQGLAEEEDTFDGMHVCMYMTYIHTVTVFKNTHDVMMYDTCILI